MPKTLLVTGASRGIGRAVALRAGAIGWTVGVGYGNDRDAALQTVARVEEAGGKAAAFAGDVAVEADVVRVFEDCERVLGSLDGVVANAGITSSAQPLTEMSAERMRRIVEVNVLGTLLCAREARAADEHAQRRAWRLDRPALVRRGAARVTERVRRLRRLEGRRRHAVHRARAGSSPLRASASTPSGPA